MIIKMNFQLLILLLAFSAVSACNNPGNTQDSIVSGSVKQSTLNLVGKWKMVSMLENFDNGDNIFQCQIMKGEEATSGALNISEYTKYEYRLKKGGAGTVTFKDTEGNSMEDMSISWSHDEDANTLSIVTDVFIRDERIYNIESISDEEMRLTLDFTYPEDDEFDRGGQRLYGSYVLKRD